MTKLFDNCTWETWLKRIPNDSQTRHFQANVSDKRGRRLFTSAYYTTREEAVAEAFKARPKAKSVTSGYGWNGTFDIRWHDRDEPTVV
jgi:hypothetical protein